MSPFQKGFPGTWAQICGESTTPEAVRRDERTLTYDDEATNVRDFRNRSSRQRREIKARACRRQLLEQLRRGLDNKWITSIDAVAWGDGNIHSTRHCCMHHRIERTATTLTIPAPAVLMAQGAVWHCTRELLSHTVPCSRNTDRTIMHYHTA